MMARSMIIICVAAAFLAAAFAAQAAVGSVISSFRMTGAETPRATGIYRDWTYVYGILYSAGSDYLTTYTPAGSMVSSATLPQAQAPRDADHSTLGTGYVDVFDFDKKMLLTYKKNAEFVKAKPLPSDTTAYAYIPGSSKYFITRDEMVFRYTTNDVLVNKFYVGGYIRGLAATPAYDGKNGEYVIIGRSRVGGYSYVYTGGGSLVDSFVVPGTGTYASVVGRANPKKYQRAYRCVQRRGSGRWAYQVDVEATAPAVAPASIGRLRALYR
ncbi:MAG: hypothetical protein V3W11_10350 [bacterium]